MARSKLRRQRQRRVALRRHLRLMLATLGAAVAAGVVFMSAAPAEEDVLPDPALLMAGEDEAASLPPAFSDHGVGNLTDIGSVPKPRFSAPADRISVGFDVGQLHRYLI